MDATALSSAGPILMPIASGMLATLSGRRLGRRSKSRDDTAIPIKEPTTSGPQSNEAVDENVETSVALLDELDRVQKRLEEGFEQDVASNPRWDHMPPIITPTYDALSEQKRIGKLGPQIAGLVDGAFEEVAKLNAALEVVKRTAAEDPRLASSQPEQFLGEAWAPIPAAKARFLGMLPTLERALREVGIPSASRRQSRRPPG